MALMTLMLHLGPTTTGTGALFKLSPGHSLSLSYVGEVLVSCTDIVMVLPGYETHWTGPQPMAWFLSLQTCLMIARPDPILDLLTDSLAWPRSVFSLLYFILTWTFGWTWPLPLGLSCSLLSGTVGLRPGWQDFPLAPGSPLFKEQPWSCCYLRDLSWCLDVRCSRGSSCLVSWSQNKSERPGELFSQK